MSTERRRWKTGNPDAMDVLDCQESLTTAVAKAGSRGYTTTELKSMTAMELLIEMAANDIRFCHKTE